MNNFLEKIGTYNIFNYLFPGVIFAYAVSEITNYSFLIEDNILVAIVTYYFIGLVLSAIGDYITWPNIKKIRKIKYEPYPDFLEASKKDKKIGLMLEMKGMFDTLTAALVSLVFLNFYDFLATKCSFLRDIELWALTFFLFYLFIKSSEGKIFYATKRIRHVNKKEDKKEAE